MQLKEKKQTNMSLIGVRASGKSTCAGLILLTALDVANNEKSKLKVNVMERTLDIRTLTDALQKGNYPDATLLGENFEASVSLKFQRKLRPSKQVNIAVTDVAGETLKEVMDYFSSGRFQLPDVHKMQNVNQFILSASSFMILTDLQYMIFGRAGVVDSQDAQLARFIDLLMRYKSIAKRSPRIKGVALILSKYDSVRDVLAVRDSISLDDDEGRRAFMRKYMIQTYQNLRDSIGEPLVDIFYSSVPPELDNDGKATGKLRLLMETRRPDYSVDEYERLISWIGRLLG